jgi:hypothetical protein
MKPVYRSGEPVAAPDDSHTAYDCTWPPLYFVKVMKNDPYPSPLGLPPGYLSQYQKLRYAYLILSYIHMENSNMQIYVTLCTSSILLSMIID